MKIKIPDCLSIRKKSLLKNAAPAAVFVVGVMIYLHRTEGAWQTADSLFLGGLLFLVIGCWSLVRWLGLFDSTVYHLEATRKNAPPMEPMPSFGEYMEQPKVIPSAGEPLLVAAVLIALSALTAWVI